jgi:predicted transporter
MKRYDRICSLLCLIIAAIVIWQSAVIPMGRVSKPGPGFLPFWVAVILALLSAFYGWRRACARHLQSRFNSYLGKDDGQVCF